jgi:lysophospholipase L1-like esterase
MPGLSPARSVPWERYVAIGDSFTEGLWDGDDADPGGVRGWADRLAGALSARRVDSGDSPLGYANLAIRGRLMRPIIAQQLRPALALKPDLVSIVGGGNDVLRAFADIESIVWALDRAVGAIRSTGADVILANSANPTDLPILNMTGGRVGRLSASTWSIARRHGAYMVDLWGMASLRDPRYWAHDRIHLTGEGHRRVANAALVALGLEPDDPAWDKPIPPLRYSHRTQISKDADWLRQDVFPWAVRHFKHESTGDARLPKRPTVTPIAPARAVGGS